MGPTGSSTAMLRGPGVVGHEGAIRNLDEGASVEGGGLVPDPATDAASVLSAVRRGKRKAT